MTLKTDSTSKREDEIETNLSNRTRLTIQIVGAAIFGALSAIAFPILKPVIDATRVPQGLALFDPISIIWMTCFLIFGPLSGLLCATVGFVTLIPFDTSLPIIAPFLKFSATISLMIAFILTLKLYKNENGSKKLREPKNYLIGSILGIILRDIVMILLNIVVYIAYFGFTGLDSWLILIAWVNVVTSLWDLLIPYAIVFGALGYGLKLDEKFEIW